MRGCADASGGACVAIVVAVVDEVPIYVPGTAMPSFPSSRQTDSKRLVLRRPRFGLVLKSRKKKKKKGKHEAKRRRIETGHSSSVTSVKRGTPISSEGSLPIVALVVGDGVL